IELSAVAVDTSGTAVAGIPLRWTIARRDWKTVRVRRIGGVFGYENVPRDSLVHTGGRTSGTEPVTFRWIPPEPGLYSFHVEGTDADGRTTRARDRIRVSGRGPAQWRRNDSGWLALEPERDAYEPGDTASFILPAPAVPTEGLLLVLDEGIRSVRRLPRIQGTPRIRIPLDGIAPPGAWAETMLIGPGIVPQGEPVLHRLPYHGWGRLRLPITTDPWRVSVEVTPGADVYAPGEEVSARILLRDGAGRPVSGTVTIAVVDDAIFELIDAPDPDPLRVFFPYRGPGIRSAELRRHLQLPVALEKGEESPGGGDAIASSPGIRRRFVATAHWEPFVPVGPSGEATIRFRLADDLTRYRIRALATAGADRFGYGDARFDVRKPIQVDWGAPRFVREEDRIEIAAIVRSRLPEEEEVEVAIEAEGAEIDGDRRREIDVEPGEAARLFFRLEHPRESGITLRLHAVAASAADHAEIEIPWRREIRTDRDFQAGRVDERTRTMVSVEPPELPDRGGLSIVISPSMAAGLDDAVDYLSTYPYGCLEQLSSTLLGLTARERIVDHLDQADPDRAARHRDAAAAIRSISVTAESWTIRSWPSGNAHAASGYVVGYALHSLLQADRADLPVPRPLLDRFTSEANERLRRLWRGRPNESPRDRETRLLRDAPWLLWVLSEADRAAVADSPLVRIRDVETLFARRAQAPPESRIALGLALANLRKRADAGRLRGSWPALSEALIEETKARDLQRTARHVWVARTDPTWGDGLGGSTRATALFLSFLTEADPADRDIPGLIA
ncbi:MAG: hypothetical protein GF328_05275, partial [Candidatus Latescibacteria bacterium]|nr:hypothetical protein [Candidatus Latescibacterota bacterium]